MNNPSQPSAADRAASRRRGLAAVGTAVSLAALLAGGYWLATARYHESTNDAYVNGNIVQITPQISGTVVAIAADDTQFVRAGQPLVRLDEADARVALDQAEAQLARTVRDVRNQFATSAQLESTVAEREADAARAQQDVARRERLAASGAVSAEELQHAREVARAADAALAAARHEYAAQRARIDHTTLEQHPDVLAAAAAVRNAYLNEARTTLTAPVSGYVARRGVQLGQRVAPGTALMAVVPLDQVWVDANFKEPELAAMRVGQPVTLTADLYGHGVTYHGRVAGFGAGTGAAFALLPAQNATGNWIKIVQRVPVRIALDRDELAAHPLQVGLSMSADVDTHDRSGPRLPQVAAVAVATEGLRDADVRAEERVRAIIAANDAPQRALEPDHAGVRLARVTGGLPAPAL